MKDESVALKDLFLRQKLSFLLLWCAFLCSILVLMVICWIFASENIFEEAVVVESDLTIFAPLLALLLAVASFCLPKYLFEHQIIAALKGHGPADSCQVALEEGHSSKPGHLSPTEQVLANLLQRRFLFFILRLALIEQIAIVGLLLALWEGSFSIRIPYAAASALLLAYARPQLDLCIAEDRRALLNYSSSSFY